MTDHNGTNHRPANRFALEPITDESFVDTAPMRYRIDVNLPVSPEYAWSEFTRQNTLDWCRALKHVTYTSARPYTVGTTRSVALAPGLATLDERFFVWDENPDAQTYRHAFHGVRGSMRGLKRFGELTEVSPTEHGCRLIWLFGIELGGRALPSWLSSSISNGAFGTVETDTLRHFCKRG